MHRFEVTLVFLIFDFGGMSISTARMRPKPEVTSPVDRATTVSHLCSSNIFYLSLSFRRYLQFKFKLRNVNVDRPEATSPFDFLTPIRYRLAVGIFRLSVTVQKLFDFYDL
jgi:hypothetical protein